MYPNFGYPSGGGAASLRTGFLRAASPFNRINISRLAGSAAFSSRYAFRYEHYIGSGDRDGLYAVFQNWGAVSGSNLSLPGNTLTISNVYLEPPIGSSVPMTISGSGTAVMADGDFDLVSDRVAPSAFGLSKFTVGERYCVRGFMDIPISGNFMRQTVNDSSISENKMFDQAATTCTNISGTGALTFSGTAPTNVNLPAIGLLGTFITGDARVYQGVGDSIMQNVNDATSGSGCGFFIRSLYNNGANILAGYNCGSTGTTFTLWTTSTQTRDRLKSIVKYCNTAVYEYGTNSFPTVGAANDPVNLAATIAGDYAVYAILRTNAVVSAGAAAYKILGTWLMPRTTGTFTDPAGQTIYGPQWDVAGDVDSYNNTKQSDVGVAGRLDYIYNGGIIVRFDPSSNANIDYHKWANNAGVALTGDGTHPLTPPHILLGAGLRAVLNTVV